MNSVIYLRRRDQLNKRCIFGVNVKNKSDNIYTFDLFFRVIFVHSRLFCFFLEIVPFDVDIKVKNIEDNNELGDLICGFYLTVAIVFFLI